jgi:hypothetical protein
MPGLGPSLGVLAGANLGFKSEGSTRIARLFSSDGETYKQALANAEVIIDEWIETAKELKRAVPEPKGRLLYA